MTAVEDNARRARYARDRARDGDMVPDPQPRRPRKAQVVGGADRWTWQCPCTGVHWEWFPTRERAQADLDNHLYFGVMHRDRGFYNTRSYR